MQNRDRNFFRKTQDILTQAVSSLLPPHTTVHANYRHSGILVSALSHRPTELDVYVPSFKLALYVPYVILFFSLISALCSGCCVRYNSLMLVLFVVVPVLCEISFFCWRCSDTTLIFFCCLFYKWKCSEYQGQQHYGMSFLISPADTPNLEELKAEECRKYVRRERLCLVKSIFVHRCYIRLGITLIPIPFWWDRTLPSLAATIHKYRPDIIPASEVPACAFPISEVKPERVLQPALTSKSVAFHPSLHPSSSLPRCLSYGFLNLVPRF